MLCMLPFVQLSSLYSPLSRWKGRTALGMTSLRRRFHPLVQHAQLAASRCHQHWLVILLYVFQCGDASSYAALKLHVNPQRSFHLSSDRPALQGDDAGTHHAPIVPALALHKVRRLVVTARGVCLICCFVPWCSS